MAIHFPEIEATYRLTNYSLDRIDWKTGTKKAVLSSFGGELQLEDTVSMVSDGNSTVYVADRMKLIAVDAILGIVRWNSSHDMFIKGKATLDYVRQANGLQKLILMDEGNMNVYNAANGEQISSSNDGMR